MSSRATPPPRARVSRKSERVVIEIVQPAAEGRKDRRVAVWAIAFGLVAAIIAGSAGIIGSIAGARLQGASNHNEARTDFLRGQQLDVYSRFLDQFDTTEAALAAQLGALMQQVLGGNSDALVQATNGRIREYNVQFAELNRTATRMVLVGRRGTIDLAIDVLEKLQEIHREQQHARTNEEIERLGRQLQTFVSQKRHEFIDSASADIRSY